MKKTYAIFLSTVLLLGGITTSCQNRASYMGTLAGANLGSTIGSAVGWLGGGGNRGNGAAIGTIVGAVGGAMIGNAVANKSTASTNTRTTDDYAYNSPKTYQFASGEWDDNTTGVFGCNSYNHLRHKTGSNSSLYISNLSFQDANGDGKLNKEETILVSYTVQNTSSEVADVELAVIEPNYYSDLAISEPTKVQIGPHQTIRYRSKVYCKHNLKGKTLELQAHANSQTAGDVYEVLKVRCDK